jgi:hypothetical protein
VSSVLVDLYISWPVRSLSERGSGGVAQTVMLWALAHSLLRGVWGHAPPEKFGNLDSLRAILGHYDSDLQFYIEHWLIG